MLFLWSCHFGVLFSVSSKLLSSERITTVFFGIMACISLNRVCTRVVQDKLYHQLLVNKNQNTIYRQTRNFNNNNTTTTTSSSTNNTTINPNGTINLTKRGNQFNQKIGFNPIARNLTGLIQVNNSHPATKQKIKRIKMHENENETLSVGNEQKKFLKKKTKITLRFCQQI